MYLTEKPTPYHLQGASHLANFNISNADSFYYAYNHKKLVSITQKNTTWLQKNTSRLSYQDTQLGEYLDIARPYYILNQIISNNYQGSSICGWSNYSFFKPSTEDSLYFGDNPFKTPEQKYLITINNEKIPFQDTIQVKKKDTLNITIQFLWLNFYFLQEIDSSVQQETIILENNHYTRIK